MTITRYDMTNPLSSYLAEVFQISIIEAWVELRSPTGPNNFFQYADFSAGYIQYTWSGTTYTISNLDFYDAQFNEYAIRHLRLNNGSIEISADPSAASRPFLVLSAGSTLNAIKFYVEEGFIMSEGYLGSGRIWSDRVVSDYPALLGIGPDTGGGSGGGGGGSGVSLPSSTTVVGGKAVATVSVNPTLVEVTLNGQPLPVGSILRNSSEGGKKYLKIAGGATAFKSISVQPDVSWNWDADGAAAWAVLQNK